MSYYPSRLNLSKGGAAGRLPVLGIPMKMKKVPMMLTELLSASPLGSGFDLS